MFIDLAKAYVLFFEILPSYLFYPLLLISP